MNYSYGKYYFENKKKAQQNCFLLTNSLGGYSSLGINGAKVMRDQSLFMGCIKAPVKRINFIDTLIEKIVIDGREYCLNSQEFVDDSHNYNGEKFIVNFTFDIIPTWHFLIDGVEILKKIVFDHKSNTLGLKYSVINPLNKNVILKVIPLYSFVRKDDVVNERQEFIVKDERIISNGYTMYVDGNFDKMSMNKKFYDDIYFDNDAGYGRKAYGCAHQLNEYRFTFDGEDKKIVFSLVANFKDVDELIEDEMDRVNNLYKKANAKDDFVKRLVYASDQFIVNRKSTKSKTIVAGYPFFMDWGRDTMLSIEGCCLATNRFDDAKDILKTFAQYIKNGLIPNMFVEDDKEPLYNTVDGALLFINAVYMYYKKTMDKAFVKSIFDEMVSIIEAYKNGTDFNIKMDEDGLIMAGDNLEQVTWMDVCVDGYLPTPRHGKPVEINAYWYNALCIMNYFADILGLDFDEKELANKVKDSFNLKFYNEELGYLKDVLCNDEYHENQLRPNQIFALSLPYTMLDHDKEVSILNNVYNKLYTPYGLRSLSIDDNEFKAIYKGTMYERDCAYHQGTVWMFLLGPFLKAYLKVNNYDESSKEFVESKLNLIKDSLKEGCVGQLAEIFDGLNPIYSKGCYAQAWSVAQILTVVMEMREK